MAVTDHARHGSLPKDYQFGDARPKQPPGTEWRMCPECGVSTPCAYDIRIDKMRCLECQSTFELQL